MKAHIGRLSLVIAFAVCSLFLLFYFNKGINKETVVSQDQVAGETAPGLPVRLIIPSINVDAGIQYVGVTSKGDMEVPSNITDVGWFNLGPRPGETGSAVISGHFNGENGEAGVFIDLYMLKKGNKLYIKDDKGITTSFEVQESRIYYPGYAEEVFSSNDTARLNLVTCDGVWDGTIKSYSKRLVVFAEIRH